MKQKHFKIFLIGIVIVLLISIPFTVYVFHSGWHNEDDWEDDWIDKAEWRFYLSGFKVDRNVYRCDWSTTVPIKDNEDVQVLGTLTTLVDAATLLDESAAADGEIQTDIDTWVGQPYGIYNDQILLFFDEKWHPCMLYDGSN